MDGLRGWIVLRPGARGWLYAARLVSPSIVRPTGCDILFGLRPLASTPPHTPPGARQRAEERGGESVEGKKEKEEEEEEEEVMVVVVVV